MNIIETPLEGVLIVEPDVFDDHRGYFLETYNMKRYSQAGIKDGFVQDNLSYSVRKTLRGMHYQLSKPQTKLVQAISGRIFDVVVDIRVGSPNFKKWYGVELSQENKRQLYVGQGLAHGFCVLSESALVTYKCNDFYDPRDEGGLLWSDPDLGIEWPVSDPILSAKDNASPLISQLGPEKLPKYLEPQA